jgi:hypothetical protein
VPKGTKVHKLFEKLKAQGMDVGQAAAISQAKTKQSLRTGKKLPTKKKR